ncbi:MAG: hypothetical protein SFV81_22540 [Pirellulaceae bacterium]|nr:hypothetical protein [Pirellulaceae bacterium]
MKRLACPAAVLALSMMFGCNSGTNDQTAQNGSQTPTPTSTAAPTQPVVVNGVGTEPAQTVAVFLDSLRRGDEAAANGVLTNLAREQVQKTNFQIQPPGNPDGKYEIGRVGYPYPEKTVALVECQWTEPTQPGQPPEVIEIVCEVHQEPEGWRISGLGFKVAGSEETLVLDFENASSLQATLEGATSTPVQPTQTAQNVAPTQLAPGQVAPGQLAPQQLPALPTGPGAPQGQATQQPAQLAFPPLNNAPVNR